MNKTAKKIVLLSIFILAVVAFRYFNVQQYFSIASIKEHINLLQNIVTEHFFIAAFLFMALYAFVMAFSLPVAAVMTLTGGFLFGTFFGAVFSNIGATVGSIALFLAVRYLIGSAIKDRYKKRFKSFEKEVQKNGYLYLLSSRLIIVFPPFVLTILAGLANLSLMTFIWTTSLGMLPAAFIYAFAGRQLRFLHTPSDVLSFPVLLAVGLIFVVSLIPILLRHIKRSKKI